MIRRVAKRSPSIGGARPVISPFVLVCIIDRTFPLHSADRNNDRNGQEIRVEFIFSRQFVWQKRASNGTTLPAGLEMKRLSRTAVYRQPRREDESGASQLDLILHGVSSCTRAKTVCRRIERERCRCNNRRRDGSREQFAQTTRNGSVGKRSFDIVCKLARTRPTLDGQSPRTFHA